LIQRHLRQLLAVFVFHEQRIARDTRVVDETLQGAELSAHPRKEILDLLLVGDVDAVCGDAGRAGLPTLVGCRGEGVGVDVDECQPCTGTCKPQRHGCAEATRSAGDDDDGVVQIHCCYSLETVNCQSLENTR
jgi:hypothetical protein